MQQSGTPQITQTQFVQSLKINTNFLSIIMQ
jgi:hypothetical protein